MLRQIFLGDLTFFTPGLTAEDEVDFAAGLDAELALLVLLLLALWLFGFACLPAPGASEDPFLKLPAGASPEVERLRITRFFAGDAECS